MSKWAIFEHEPEFLFAFVKGNLGAYYWKYVALLQGDKVYPLLPGLSVEEATAGRDEARANVVRGTATKPQAARTAGNSQIHRLTKDSPVSSSEWEATKRHLEGTATRLGGLLRGASTV